MPTGCCMPSSTPNCTLSQRHSTASTLWCRIGLSLRKTGPCTPCRCAAFSPCSGPRNEIVNFAIDWTPVSLTVLGIANITGIMTVVESPETILFTSTTQSFLQKEAPLRRAAGTACRGRVLRSRMVATRGRTRVDGSAGPGGVRRRQRLGQRCRGFGNGRRATRQDGGARTAVSGQRRTHRTRRKR